MQQEVETKEQSWWKRRTSLERGLVVLGALALIVITALVIALTVLVVSHQPMDICLTPECTIAASMTIKKMDLTVAPCDDFYSYACGTFVRSTNIPDDKTEMSTYQEVIDLVLLQQRSILEEPVSLSGNRPITLAKHIYKACMNKTRIEARGLEPARKILRELHGWPVLEGDAWKSKAFDWKNFMNQLKSIGLEFDSLISYEVGPDAKNSSNRKIHLDTAELGLSREYLVKGFDDHTVVAYYKYMVDIAVLFGSNRERATRELKQSLEFEMALANISPSSEARRDGNVLYNPMTIAELQTNYSTIPWLEYVNNMLPQQVRVGNEYVVIVAVPNYITNLEVLLNNTDKRVLANYCMWRVVAELVPLLTQELQDRTLLYTTVKTGQIKEDPRWKTCTELVSSAATLSLGSLYVTKLFDKTSKEAAMDMVIDIQNAFQQTLMKLDWMDERTKQKAISKAKSISAHIGYPDELLDTDKLEKYYEKLFVNEDFYVETYFNISKFQADYGFGLLHSAVNKTDWTTHGNVAEVNAFYEEKENSIQLPAAILQGSFFGSGRPKYMNYGAIGSIIGHEIIHGFDDQGRLYDDGGNLVDWWDHATSEKFLTRAACIVNQYGNYTDKSTGLNLNGVNTQGENIADNGGIKEAYLAYTAWSDRLGKAEPRLPGFVALSPRQMFWVSTAQVWCSKQRAEEMAQWITTGVHSLEEFRVLGPISNMDDFARDFNCPVGSNMNPAKKCQVW